jgi:hypothetical protein
MKHIAVPCRGAYDASRPFTATGLGDRIHAVTIAWSYSQAHGTPVTLHLTSAMMQGGQFGNKPESWREILSLLPAGHVSIQAHSESPRTADEWMRISGAEPYTYSDYQQRAGFDAVPYLKAIPLLEAEPQSVDLPERFFTTQWDAGGQARRRPRNFEGYDGVPVTVGGEGDVFRWDLKLIGFAMSRAYAHVGVDSAFFHLAQLYMPARQIHLHCGEQRSHHVLRARDNGARIN